MSDGGLLDDKHDEKVKGAVPTKKEEKPVQKSGVVQGAMVQEEKPQIDFFGTGFADGNENQDSRDNLMADNDLAELEKEFEA